MSDTDFKSLPLDAASSSALDATGLRYALVDTNDATAFDAWLRADSRGFHDDVPDAGRLASTRHDLAHRRTTEVRDASAPAEAEPVGTVSSWITALTTSARRRIPAWAISAVTVSPTHAGRGIARAMLEGELRTGRAAGCPVAVLTVTEATLYSRYGFAPAAFWADWRISTKRVRWSAPTPPGRVELMDAEGWRSEIDELYARVQRAEPGHIDAWSRRFDQLAGLTGEDKGRIPRLRAARYLDTDGVVRGLMLYRVIGNDDDFAANRLTIDLLTTETDDAYAALWRLALTMPLVTEVTAPMRRVDEPVRWLIGDSRAARVQAADGLWLRVLDVPSALASRAYDAAGSVLLHLTDPLGDIDGEYLLTVTPEGEVSADRHTGAAPDDASELALGVAELSAVLLGGVSVRTLAAAGRIAARPEDVRAATALFRTAHEPWLAFWF